MGPRPARLKEGLTNQPRVRNDCPERKHKHANDIAEPMQIAIRCEGNNEDPTAKDQPDRSAV